MDPLYNSPHTSILKRPIARIFLYLFFTLLCGLILIYYTLSYLDTPHADFPINIDIVIEEGESQKAITEHLAEKKVVRSSFYMQLLLARNFKEAFIKAGVYRFTEPRSSSDIAFLLTEGLNRSPEVTMTLPEGFKANDLYLYLPGRFSSIEKRELSSYEGYLFPDTYFISQDMTFEEILAMLKENFRIKIQTYTDEVQQSGFTEEEIVILASIVEREAKDADSKRMVSGILQNRLRIDMPLQVDATFDYILGKASHELTDADLEIDSPFNTYNNEGLPPAPIANPGLDSIVAVLKPSQSEYLYYLTGDDGTFHYAKTFEEHKKNKARYLK